MTVIVANGDPDWVTGKFHRKIERIQDLQAVCRIARDCQLVDAIIAGGAVRDLHINIHTGTTNAPRDIDIFVKMNLIDAYVAKGNGTQSEFERACTALASCIGTTAKFRDPEECDSGESVVDFCEIAYEGIPGGLQVIGIAEDPIDDIAEYDFHASRCFVTPRTSWMAREAQYDISYRRFTYDGERNPHTAAFGRSLKRYERLSARYPFHQFVNCSVLQK